MPQTNSQKMAQAAYRRIVDRRPEGKFASFAREFPSLVHSCGFAQALAFAMSKKAHHMEYMDDLSAVLAAVGVEQARTSAELGAFVRECDVAAYVRLSRHTLQAAGWLKRYVEAEEED